MGKNHNNLEIQIGKERDNTIIGPNRFNTIANGLEVEETDGLLLEDRKRRRSGLESEVVMEVDNILPRLGYIEEVVALKGTVISGTDSIETKKNDLATLAAQASRPL